MTTWFSHVTNGHPFFVAVFIPHICAHTQVYYIYWRKRKNVPWGNRQHNSLLLEYWLLSLRVLVHCSLCFYQKYATRIYLCVIAVSKSQEFWSKFVDFIFFRRRRLRLHVVIFSTTTQRIRLRRRVDVFSTTSDTIHPFPFYQNRPTPFPGQRS